jgi:hypothetical protein
MQSKTPTHTVFIVCGDGDKKRWIEIGAAWRHRDNDGLNVVMDALPPNGRIVLRPTKASIDGGPK